MVFGKIIDKARHAKHDLQVRKKANDYKRFKNYETKTAAKVRERENIEHEAQERGYGERLNENDVRRFNNFKRENTLGRKLEKASAKTNAFNQKIDRATNKTGLYANKVGDRYRRSINNLESISQDSGFGGGSALDVNLGGNLLFGSDVATERQYKGKRQQRRQSAPADNFGSFLGGSSNSFLSSPTNKNARNSKSGLDHMLGI